MMSRKVGDPCDLCMECGHWTAKTAAKAVVVARRPVGLPTSPARELFAMCAECAAQGPIEAWEHYELVEGDPPEGSDLHIKFLIDADASRRRQEMRND